MKAYQKGAIYRQMQEYKRAKALLETRLDDVEKRSIYHDDHLRIIDAWLRQVSIILPVHANQ
jgi:E3 ubiquitin-protein ligase BRE1